MGWTCCSSSYYRRDNLIRMLASADFNGARYSVVEYAAVGNHVWQIVRDAAPDPGEPETGIVLYHIQPGGRGEGWCYKGVSAERSDVFDCPLSFLEKVPETDDAGDRAWREGVRIHHAARATRRRAVGKLDVGQKLVLRGRIFQIVQRIAGPRAAQGWIVRCDNSHNSYRMQGRLLSEAITESIECGLLR